MKSILGSSNSRSIAAPTLRQWLAVVACGSAAGFIVAAGQRDDTAAARPVAAATQAPARAAPPREAFAPTFADAAESLRQGRHAEAYGRFVTLADQGDVDAARIALVMHRYGPTLFGSAWDASVEQLAEWTRWSAAAADKDLDALRASLATGNRARPPA